MMLEHKPLDGAQIVGLYAPVTRQPRITKPEFAFSFGSADMDMWRFIAFIGVKVKTEGTDAQNRWHVQNSAVTSTCWPGSRKTSPESAAVSSFL